MLNCETEKSCLVDVIYLDRMMNGYVWQVEDADNNGNPIRLRNKVKRYFPDDP